MTRVVGRCAVLLLAALMVVVAHAPGAVAAPAAGATTGDGRVIVVRVENIVFRATTDACPVARATFSLRWLSGAPRGSGVACVRSVVGDCEPLVAGCQQTVRGRVTYRLADGSVSARAVLHEVGTSPSSLIQWVRGTVVRGTGDFAGATGRLAGAGDLTFAADGSIASTLVHVITLREAAAG